MAIEKLLTPVGRIVWGHPMREVKKVNYTTKQPVLKDGKEVSQWVCGVAFPKAEFQAKVWPSLYQEALTMYPNGTPRDFSWKYVDGDTIDDKGQPYSNREGYAGNIVLTVSTEAFCPPVYKFENGAYRQLAENEIKCGDYVVLNLNLKCHQNNSGGIYINPNGFELVGYGQEIVSRGADANELFKGQQYQLPVGASMQPVSSAPVGVTMPMAAQPVQQPVGMPMDAQPVGMPAPAVDFVNNVMGNAPVQNAVGQVQYQTGGTTNQMGVTSAPNAMTSPSNNGMPGMPPAR